MKQMQDIRNETVPLIRDTCMALTGHANDNEVAQMLGTAVAESSLIHRVQIDGGPARGLWQMEPTTGVDIFENYLMHYMQRDRFYALMEIWLELAMRKFVPYIVDVEHHLEKYDDFACAMARIHYLRNPDPIPDTLEGQAKYWLKAYNRGGKGTVEHYLAQWDALECDKLMED